ncbi:MAG: hypothetical protein ACYC6M_00040 [Terriglobales bacterium]
MKTNPDPLAPDPELEAALRAALRREDAAPEFTARILAAARTAPAKTPWLQRRTWAALAVAAALVLGAVRGLELRERQERRAGETAKAQLMVAMQITNRALQHTEERALDSLPPLTRR